MQDVEHPLAITLVISVTPLFQNSMMSLPSRKQGQNGPRTF
jgi:hypothetical protein